MPQKFLVVIQILFISACAFRKDPMGESAQKGRDEVAREFQTSAILLKEDLKTEFIPQDQIHHYQAVVSWHGPRELKILAKYNDGTSDQSKTPLEIDARTKNQFIVNCIAGAQKIVVDLTAFSPKYSKVTSEFKFEVKCPKDLSIVGEAHEVPDDINGRLFFSRGSILKFHGRKFPPQLIGIVAEGQTTIRFLEDSVEVNAANYTELPEAIKNAHAAPKNPLPPIEVKLKFIKGPIRFELFGFAGKTGAPGPEHERAAQGPKGADGILELKTGTQAVHGFSQFRCMIQPGNGEPGANGTFSGTQGGEGSRGIDSPRLFLTVEKVIPENTRIEIYSKPGIGGKGGAPGAPQAGGLGGEPGANPSNECIPAQKGPDGKSLGSIGAPGIDGANGNCGQVSVTANLRGFIFPAAEDTCLREPSVLQYR